jgi:hypothetical protein
MRLDDGPAASNLHPEARVAAFAAFRASAGDLPDTIGAAAAFH